MSDYPNERDCEHGHLRRSCEICELQRELAEYERTELLKLAERNGLIAENARLREALELIADHGGTYCADEEMAITCNGSWCAEQARCALEI
jgi:hypothetical protein